MRLILLLVVGISAVGCHPRSYAERMDDLQFRAVVMRDSAVFVMPVSSGSVWEWNTSDTIQPANLQYSLKVSWNPPGIWQGEGVGLLLLQPEKAELRRGSLAELISAGVGKSFVPSRMIAGWETSPEPQLSAKVHGNSVILVLRQSDMLDRLKKAHPLQVYFQSRLPKDSEVNSNPIPVEYRE